jgi:hypothetical protein
MVSFESFITKFFRPHHGPRVDLDFAAGVRTTGGVGLITLPPSCADHLEIWEPQTPGNHRVYPGLYRDFFYVFVIHEDNYKLF